MRASKLWRWAIWSGLFAACGIAELDLTGKSCPCPDGYYCDSVTNVCRKGVDPGDASVDQGMGGSAGSGGTEADAPPDGPPPADAADAGCLGGELEPARRLASGRMHNCVIRKDAGHEGQLWCWGENGKGQLGVSMEAGSKLYAAHRVGSGSDWSDVAAGLSHTCGLKSSGAVYCWGDNEKGQLGIGATPLQKTDPTQVAPTSDKFVRITAGDYHTCAITEQRRLWCWGSNAGGGPLGLGQASLDKSVPVPNPVGDTLDLYGSISGGQGHTCGVRTDGRLWCWGANQCGQTGHAAQQIVPELVGAGGCFARVFTGSNSSCTLSPSGELACFGGNEAGQLGRGTVTAKADGGACVSAPSAKVELPAAVLTAGGNYLHFCAITTAHELYCWGHNEQQQTGSVACLGPSCHEPTPYQVSPDKDWAEVDGGFFHTCAMKEDGTVWCIGGNQSGQLGGGTADAGAGKLIQVEFAN